MKNKKESILKYILFLFIYMYIKTTSRGHSGTRDELKLFK
jgi:hypothetical protein